MTQEKDILDHGTWLLNIESVAVFDLETGRKL
jgi:hypothetical protein